MTVTTIDPVIKTVAVRASQARAFEVFTARFGEWWPPSHHTGDEDFETVVIEPRVGGRWFERSASGAEHDWGQVLVWEPPERVVLAWQLDADFRPTLDASQASEVAITFIAQDHQSTLVTLEHRNLERFGDRAPDVRSSLDAPGGWGGIIQSYADFVGA